MRTLHQCLDPLELIADPLVPRVRGLLVSVGGLGLNLLDAALRHALFDEKLRVTNLGHDHDVVIEVHNRTLILKVSEARDHVDRHHIACNKGNVDGLPTITVHWCDKNKSDG